MNDHQIDRRELYGPKTSKADLVRLLDGTTHQASALLLALEDIISCYDRNDGPEMTVAMAHADYVVAKAKAGQKIE